MTTIESAYNNAQGIEQKFKNKAILFVGSESYDAPAITVLEGLHKLGFTVYTLNKANINSWFCNKVISEPENFVFDFVLSNLHWGTQWSLYTHHRLHRYFRVLIDGDDNHRETTWRQKYQRYLKTYRVSPPEEIKQQALMPYRWVEPLEDYQPDIVFTSQKQSHEHESVYLPFGIHDIYKKQNRNLSTKDRKYTFIHVKGPGHKREAMAERLDSWMARGIFTKKTFNGYAKGKDIYPSEIAEGIEQDNNVHSYHRWVMRSEYFSVLNQSNVLIYPGIGVLGMPFWDSKRPWEAYASGCMVLMEQPLIDVSQYPLTEINPFAVFQGKKEFYAKSLFLTLNKRFLHKQRLLTVERANKYFSSDAIARYFLFHIWQTQNQ